jgi:hypothetical protein
MVAPNVSSPLAVQEFTSTKTKDVQMTDATLSLTAAPTYEGTNRLILGIVLAVVTFWLFAQTTLNVARPCATTCTSPQRKQHRGQHHRTVFWYIYRRRRRTGRPIRPGEADQYRCVYRKPYPDLSNDRIG